VPGVVFDMVEWVSADTRRPLHAVVITVNAPRHSRLMFFVKAEDLTLSDLVLELLAQAVVPVDRDTRAARLRE
jgi:hypothetical protein